MRGEGYKKTQKAKKQKHSKQTVKTMKNFWLISYI